MADRYRCFCKDSACGWTVSAAPGSAGVPLSGCPRCGGSCVFLCTNFDAMTEEAEIAVARRLLSEVFHRH